MNALVDEQTIMLPRLAWTATALAGLVAPLSALFLMPQLSVGALGAVFAVGLMGAGILGASAAHRFGIGLSLAVGSAAVLAGICVAQGLAGITEAGLLVGTSIIAAISFAARGALFARSSGPRGWLIGFGVVMGEAAILATSSIEPGSIPQWLLVLLPAQWASTAIQAALVGSASPAAWASLAALAGTAVGTSLVTRLWPRRWPYLIMASTWLSLSALVWWASNTAVP